MERRTERMKSTRSRGLKLLITTYYPRNPSKKR
uniref:Ribosomal protein L33 n=1 Tax=Steinernema glaseri TaxID=37863 RepID=A0A1I8A6C4_9BILA